MASPAFWDDTKAAQDIVEQLKGLKSVVEPWQKATQSTQDHLELIELLELDQPDEIKHFEKEVEELMRAVSKLELEGLLSDPLDQGNAIASLNAGAGGTESCDWAEMLLRMYSRWAENSGFSIAIVDIQDGEEAGIKSVTFMVKGRNAYGYLKNEIGVHRLVRISPFDSNKRRHTSFASLDVVPETEDTSEIEINEGDIRVDVYRSGGAGGQSVNKTSSAVRLTHLPSKIVVQCQNERSQHQNKYLAMKILKSRLLDKKRREEEAELQAKYGEKKKIEWGSQIRSYVYHPYTLVKDHRTNVETSNGQAVLDGDLDAFMQAYLKQTVQEKEERKRKDAG